MRVWDLSPRLRECLSHIGLLLAGNREFIIKISLSVPSRGGTIRLPTSGARLALNRKP